MENVYHIPALLRETIDGLAIKQDGVYVDVTFGGGGHSRAILAQLGANGRLFSFDQDLDAYENRLDDPRWQFVHSNFRYLNNFMRYYEVEQINGLLADLGVSFHHFDAAERGFSFRFEGPLDMRMNQKSKKTAAQVINEYNEEDLARVLYLYGEMKNSRAIARAICKRRSTTPILRTEELTALLVQAPLLSPHEGGRTAGKKLHLADIQLRDAEKKDLARVFQALRIEVNDEMSALQEMLTAAKDMLAPGGRIAILTYHSLEDRLVKNFFRSGNLAGEIEKDFYGNILSPFRLVNNKVIVASEEEVARNPRARSAKLRIAEKV